MAISRRTFPDVGEVYSLLSKGFNLVFMANRFLFRNALIQPDLLRFSKRRFPRAGLIRLVQRVDRDLKIFCPNLKTVLPNAVPQSRDIEGYVDQREPLREEGPW